ncbi:Uncharacterised protein [Mycobacteroides abscessus subsp. abscessus]|nr:Uncharacterised protein [Mycobacteroides abscessus subsp. abscessus]
MLIRGVVGHDVHDQADPRGVQGLDHRVEVLQGADLRVHVPVVGDVVAAVGQVRRVERAQPHGVDPELAQVRHALGDAAQVPDAVAVRVREGAGVDLVDGGLAPPLRVRGEGDGGCVLGALGAHAVRVSFRDGRREGRGGYLTAPWVSPAMTHFWEIA